MSLSRDAREAHQTREPVRNPGDPSMFPVAAGEHRGQREGSDAVAGRNAGFPSGHSIGAFSLATVFARRYREHRWVPWVAYGLAGLVSFSRITAQAHFPSDVFV